MYPTVKEVVPQSDFLLLLTYENGKKRQFDMKPYLHIGMFTELKDQELFKTARPSFDTMEWDNEADFDPEVLYADCVLILIEECTSLN